MRNVIILLSGGLDSTVAAYVARCELRVLHALTINYGQRNFRNESKAAIHIGRLLEVTSHRLIDATYILPDSPLTDYDLNIPTDRPVGTIGPAPTIVPGRNLFFLAIAAAWAQKIGGADIYHGANADDAAGYPDCRRGFFHGVASALNYASPDERIDIETPLLDLTKKEVILLGRKLGAPVEQTFSCYDPSGNMACGRCDACKLRAEAFDEADQADWSRDHAGGGSRK